MEMVQNRYIHSTNFTIAGHTMFAPDQLFSNTIILVLFGGEFVQNKHLEGKKLAFHVLSATCDQYK